MRNIDGRCVLVK